MGNSCDNASPDTIEERGKANASLNQTAACVCDFLGTAFGFASFMFTLMSLVFFNRGAYDDVFLLLLCLSFSLAFLLCYVVMFLFADFMQKHGRILMLASLLLDVLSLIPFSDTFLNGYYPCVRIVFIGIASSLAICYWVDMLRTHENEEVRPTVCIVLLVGFFCCMGLMFFNAELLAYILFALIALSDCLYFLRLSIAGSSDQSEVSAKDSDQRMHISWKSRVLTAMGSFSQGFSLLYFLRLGEGLPVMSFVLAAGCFLFAAVLLADSRKVILFSENLIRRLSLFVLSACALVLLLVPTEVKFVPCLLMFCFALFPYAGALFAVGQHIVRFNLSTIHVFGWSRSFSILGLIAGFLIGWEAFFGSLFGSMTFSVCIVVVTLLFILMAAVLGMDSLYPDDISKKNAKASTNANAPSSSEAYEETIDAFYQKKCKVIAEEYGLTNRQAEVLTLLARGRDASYIQQKLYISRDTAKAHISAIYQKTNTHKRQDLIDLVEDASIADD